MNWEAIDAISGALGALVVVISLIYVGIQIRQNTKVARSATRQAITELFIDSNKDIVGDPDLAGAFIKDLNGQELNDVERLRVLSRAYLALRNWENIHYQFRNGMLTQDEWQGFRLNLKAIFEWRTVRTVWDNEKQFFSMEFQNEIDEILKDVPEPRIQSHGYAVTGEKKSQE